MSVDSEQPPRMCWNRNVACTLLALMCFLLGVNLGYMYREESFDISLLLDGQSASDNQVLDGKRLEEFENGSSNAGAVELSTDGSASPKVATSTTNILYEEALELVNVTSSIDIKVDVVTMHKVCYHLNEQVVYLFSDRPLSKIPFFRHKLLDPSKWLEIVNYNKGLVARKHEKILILNDDLHLAHCLEDMLFTLFIVQPEGVRFDKYITMSKTSEPGLPCDYKHVWCCHAFVRTGIIVLNQTVQYVPPWACFHSVMIPYFGNGRYAPVFENVTEIEHIAYNKLKHLYPKNSFNLTHLQNLHRKLRDFDDEFTDVLSAKRAPLYRTNVLVIDRSHSLRRRWNNALEFVTLLVSKWNELSNQPIGEINYFGKDFSLLTPADQLREFHRADVIFSVHGAEMSNLIAGAAQRTVAFEVNCVNVGAPIETRQFTAQERTWFGLFTTRLGMQVFRAAYPQPNLQPCTHQMATGFWVNASHLFEYVKQTKVFSTPVP